MVLWTCLSLASEYLLVNLYNALFQMGVPYNIMAAYLHIIFGNILSMKIGHNSSAPIALHTFSST